jgi:hypothetical protein
MESFMNLPWWAQVVFVATNAFILLILIILLNQWVKSQKANLFVKKKIKPANERGKEYGSEHPSSYIDA